MAGGQKNGLSNEIAWLSQATVVPAKARAFSQKTGVLDARGDHVALGETWHSKRLLTQPADLPETAEARSGSFFYAGVLKDHFGHAITEGIARFWALADINLDRIDAIVFTPNQPHKTPGSLKVITQILRQLGIETKVEMIFRPTRFERLCVPGQGYGLGDESEGLSETRDLFQSRFAKTIAPGPHPKIYLSRSKLDPLSGGAFNEKQLETCLKTDGYHIIHPQDLSLEEQIAAIKGARCVVGLEGSAFHLASLVDVPGQKVAVLRRDARNAKISQMLARQIKAMSPDKHADVVDSILCFHRPTDVPRGWRGGLATLDLGRMFKNLSDLGLVDTADITFSPTHAINEAQAFIDTLPQEYSVWHADGKQA